MKLESACSSKHKRQSLVPSGFADDLSASSRPSEIGRAHSAKEMHRSYARSSVCVCVCVRVCSTCVCMYRSDRPPRHERTRGTRSPPTFTFTLTFTLAPGSRGYIGSRHTIYRVYRARAPSGPYRHTIVKRNGTATRDDGTTSCRLGLFVLQFSASSARGSLLQREMPTVCYRRSSSSIVSSLSAYVCRTWKLSLSCHRPLSNCGC